ncbi:uncharacterized protein LOC108678144 isoform X2 [Hyalella azteca]|uniref:Uncharacterized protein LOC108678144 isoform X2 n=1 Tax=Hyalella azteca TaxID=294128 RepID=A0A8B7P7P7_HYAAZ|nr:uncharacterized protein LOC108678144 isoform X2 [Hyalella azteca]
MRYLNNLNLGLIRLPVRKFSGLSCGSLQAFASTSMDADVLVQEAVENGMLTRRPGEREEFKCELCLCYLTGFVPAVDHLRGSSHEKIFLQQHSGTVAVIPGTQETASGEDLAVDLKNLVEAGVLVHKIEHGITSIFCNACQAHMNGSLPAIGHIQGAQHSKRMRSWTSTAGSASAAALNSSLPKESVHVNVSSNSCKLEDEVSKGVMLKITMGSVIHYKCSVCNTTMTGEPPALTHIAGERHRKALIRAATSLNCSSVSSPGTSRTSSSLTQAFKSERSSDVHDSAAAANKTDEEIMNEALDSGVLRRTHAHFFKIEEYECTVCRKTMTGCTPAVAHLKGISHVKALRQRSGSSSPFSSSTNSSCSDLVAASGDQDCKRIEAAVAAGMVNRAAKRCIVCDLVHESYSDLERHLGSEYHRKNEKRWAAKKEPVDTLLKTRSDILSALPVLDGQLNLAAFVERGEVLVLERNGSEDYKCVRCDVILNAVDSLRAHLLGSKHRKGSRPTAGEGQLPVPSSPRSAVLSHDTADGDSSSSDDSSDVETPIFIAADQSLDQNVEFMNHVAKMRRRHARRKVRNMI